MDVIFIMKKERQVKKFSEETNREMVKKQKQQHFLKEHLPVNKLISLDLFHSTH